MGTLNSTETVTLSSRFEAFQREGSLSPCERVALTVASLIALSLAALAFIYILYPSIDTYHDWVATCALGFFIFLTPTVGGIGGLYLAATAPSELESKETPTPEVEYTPQ